MLPRNRGRIVPSSAQWGWYFCALELEPQLITVEILNTSSPLRWVMQTLSHPLSGYNGKLFIYCQVVYSSRLLHTRYLYNLWVFIVSIFWPLSLSLQHDCICPQIMLGTRLFAILNCMLMSRANSLTVFTQVDSLSNVLVRIRIQPVSILVSSGVWSSISLPQLDIRCSRKATMSQLWVSSGYLKAIRIGWSQHLSHRLRTNFSF